MIAQRVIDYSFWDMAVGFLDLRRLVMYSNDAVPDRCWLPGPGHWTTGGIHRTESRLYCLVRRADLAKRVSIFRLVSRMVFDAARMTDSRRYLLEGTARPIKVSQAGTFLRESMHENRLAEIAWICPHLTPSDQDFLRELQDLLAPGRRRKKN